MDKYQHWLPDEAAMGGLDLFTIIQESPGDHPEEYEEICTKLVSSEIVVQFSWIRVLAIISGVSDQ